MAVDGIEDMTVDTSTVDMEIMAVVFTEDTSMAGGKEDTTGIKVVVKIKKKAGVERPSL
jgi:hypothetical protein